MFKLYKKSFFNLEVQETKGEKYIFNSLNNKIFCLNEQLSILYKNIPEDGIEYTVDLDQLIKNQIIVSSSLDEKKVAFFYIYENIFNNDFNITILPTNACNFKCVYCAQESHPTIMSENTQNNLIKYIKKNVLGNKNITIQWFGGEPLLAKNIIFNIMTNAKRICSFYRVPLISYITTNGYLLDLDTFKQLISLNILNFQITLDGLKERHNITRPLHNGDGSYDVILHNLLNIKHNIKSANFKIGIRINIDKTCLDSIDTIINNFACNFANDSRFVFIVKLVVDMGGDRIQEIESNLINDDAILMDIHYKFIRAGLNIFNDFSIGNRLLMCDSSYKNSMMINCDGNIYKCSNILCEKNVSHDIKEMNHIGYLDSTGNANIDNSKLAQWLLRNPYPQECINCKLFPSCLGERCPYLYLTNERRCLLKHNIIDAMKIAISHKNYIIL